MKLKELVDKTRVFLLDLDGTVYLEDTPIGDMINTLAKVRASGRKAVYCTNNSSKTAAEYVKKLTRLGLWATGDEIVTSALATADYLNSRYPNANVYFVATDAVKAEFARMGVKVAEAKDADVCVVAYDTSLTFEKLAQANELIVKGKPFIATHPDDVCPAKGVYPPDVGSFLALLERSSGRRPDLICGKPFTVMGDYVAKVTGTEKAFVTMVGDRPHTDIRFGNNNGFHTLLVLSGETGAEKAATLTGADKPEVIADSLNDISPLL